VGERGMMVSMENKAAIISSLLSNFSKEDRTWVALRLDEIFSEVDYKGDSMFCNPSNFLISDLETVATRHYRHQRLIFNNETNKGYFISFDGDLHPGSK
jgi:hypothetical protein